MQYSDVVFVVFFGKVDFGRNQEKKNLDELKIWATIVGPFVNMDNKKRINELQW